MSASSDTRHSGRFGEVLCRWGGDLNSHPLDIGILRAVRGERKGGKTSAVHKNTSPTHERGTKGWKRHTVERKRERERERKESLYHLVLHHFLWLFSHYTYSGEWEQFVIFLAHSHSSCSLKMSLIKQLVRMVSLSRHFLCASESHSFYFILLSLSTSDEMNVKSKVNLSWITSQLVTQTEEKEKKKKKREKLLVFVTTRQKKKAQESQRRKSQGTVRLSWAAIVELQLRCMLSFVLSMAMLFFPLYLSLSRSFSSCSRANTVLTVRASWSLQLLEFSPSPASLLSVSVVCCLCAFFTSIDVLTHAA